jgi:hypothetical protein
LVLTCSVEHGRYTKTENVGRHDGDAEYGFVIITLKSVILAESARAINNLLGYDKYYTSAPGVPYCYDLRENH